MCTPTLGCNAIACAGSNRCFFELTHQRNDFAKARKPHDRIDDDLTRTVIRHIASAFDLVNLDAGREQRFTRHEQAVRLALTADRDDGIVFDGDPDVMFAARGDIGVQRALQRPCLRVRAAPKIEKPRRPDGVRLRRASSVWD